MEVDIQDSPYFKDLSQDDLTLLRSKMHRHCYCAGDILLAPGNTCKQLYFIVKGLVYAYEAHENERILWYEAEGSFCTDIISCYQNLPAKNYIQVAEDESILLSISLEDMLSLCHISHTLSLWYMHFLQDQMVRLTLYYEDLRVKDASQRYHEFVEKFPEALQRMPLGHIASYLGMSQVSLSRIRAKHQKKAKSTF